MKARLVGPGHISEAGAISGVWLTPLTTVFDCFVDALGLAPFEKFVFTNYPIPRGAQVEGVEGTKWAPLQPDWPAQSTQVMKCVQVPCICCIPHAGASKFHLGISKLLES